MLADNITSNKTTQDLAEEWRDVDGFIGYQVSDQGRVRSFHLFGGSPTRKKRTGITSRLLKPAPNNKGYLRVFLVRDGKAHTRYVHRLVLMAFCGNPGNGFEVMHKDDKVNNNTLANLKWGTRQDNVDDCKAKGRNVRGVKQQHAKLNDESVRLIRKLYREGIRVTYLAWEFGVCHAIISEVCSGKRWSHVTDGE